VSVSGLVDALIAWGALAHLVPVCGGGLLLLGLAVRHRLLPPERTPARTPRQVALLRELEGWHAQNADSPRTRAAAEERAWQLLQRTLSAEQARTLKEERSFTAQAPSGRRYRIAHDGAIYGLRGQTDTLTDRFCLVPTTALPRGDRLLALKLMIETNEQGFLQTAVRRRLG
jgi:hypothetical protein